MMGELVFHVIINGSQCIFPLLKPCSCKYMCVFFSLSPGMRRTGCHNTLLVFWGPEEPGSAPVTQLLTALVLSFGLTSSTYLLVLRFLFDLFNQSFSAEMCAAFGCDFVSNAISNFFFPPIYVVEMFAPYCFSSDCRVCVCVCVCLRTLIWTHMKRLLGKCIPMLHWQQM